MTDFLLYGATGYVGAAVARAAARGGLRPMLAARDARRLEPLARELGLEMRTFELDDGTALDHALRDVPLVLHCAGPFIHTYAAMVEGCVRTGTHHLDLTGEIAVYKGIADRHDEAAEEGVMLLPGVGFDVVATDCVALHLKQRLPSATRLELAFQPRGPAGPPPGTQRTALETLSEGARVRRDGVLRPADAASGGRTADFGRGPVDLVPLTWGDVFTAYHSTGIPNISTYAALPPAGALLISAAERLRWLLGRPAVRRLLRRLVRPGAGPDALKRTSTHVWGRVEDDEGRSATARLHGPEAGLVWTTAAALACVRKVLDGNVVAGYTTPARAYGADLVLECDGVTREDVG